MIIDTQMEKNKIKELYPAKKESTLQKSTRLKSEFKTLLMQLLTVVKTSFSRKLEIA